MKVAIVYSLKSRYRPERKTFELSACFTSTFKIPCSSVRYSFVHLFDIHHLCASFMSNKFISWSIFVILCVIWGSSFNLMQASQYGLTPAQIAALRIFSAGLVFL